MNTKTFETRNWKQNSIPVAYYQTCKASKMSCCENHKANLKMFGRVLNTPLIHVYIKL